MSGFVCEIVQKHVGASSFAQLGQLTDPETRSTYFLESNITILNTGFHYVTMACSEEGNHYCNDLVTALDALAHLSRASHSPLPLVSLDSAQS